MTSNSIHQLSHAGYGGSKSELYDKARYGYVPIQLAFMHSALTSKDRLNVAEMGAGTGLLTRALLADSLWNPTISELKCSEPVEGMRDVFTQTIQDPRFTIVDGTFEQSGVPDAWADVILAATAFHWCNDLEAAIEEFNRILRPDGIIIFIWQLEDRSVGWVEQMWQLGMLYQNATGKTMIDFRHWRFYQMFDLPSYKAHFHDPEESEVKYTIHGTLESVINRFKTWSAIAAQPNSVQEDLISKLGAIVENGDDLRWVNEAEGILEIPMATPVVVIRRK